MKKLAILVAVALAVGLALPSSSEATSLSEVKKLTASDAEADDYFGQSVAVSGDIAVVGADLEDAGSKDAGAAYVFSRNQGGTDNWGQVKKLTASDAEEVDRFAYSVAVSGEMAVVGAYREDTGGIEAGAAYVFHRNQGGTDNWGEVKKLTASDAEAYDWFGRSVAVSGEIAFVGAWWEDTGGSNAGAAYIFQRDKGGTDNWGQVKKLTASPAQGGAMFGTSVAVSGDIAVVGAFGEDAAYVFSRNQGGTDNWGQVQKLTASDPGADDWFGTSVAVSGDIAVVGAHAEGAGGDEAGAAYVFSRNQGGTDNWGEVEKFTASDTEAGDFFGFSVAVSGEVAVVGAVAEDAGGLNAGAAYVFQSMGVGGIAEPPDVAESASASSSPPYAALAGAGVSGAVLLMAGAWYAMRRRRVG